MITPQGGGQPRHLSKNATTALHALLVVPPHLRYVSGPLLGCALLHGASAAAGLNVAQLDLAVRRWHEHVQRTGARYAPRGDLRGDHDRPFDANDVWCRTEEDTLERLLGVAPPLQNVHSRPAMSLPYSFEAVEAAADRLVRSPDGDWIRGHLARFPAPRVLGLSVLYAGQVVWAYAVGRIARSLWPGVVVVWGGPHVTALAAQIAADTRYGRAADAFVVGHAERTWVEIVQAVAVGRSLPAAAGRAGQGPITRAEGDPRAMPVFADVELYGPRLTLPVQTTIGCAYGRCTFCTYPAVEGALRDLDLGVLDAVLQEAESLGAVIAVKDSLVLAPRLRAIAARIGGRVEWSACTKLNPALDTALLTHLVQQGCRTLELGVETMLPASQRLIRKVQPEALLLDVLDAAAAARLPIVANYITGFPGEDPADADRTLAWLESAISARAPSLRAKVEHHRFELDRLAPIAGASAPPGLRVISEWPWSSVLDWQLEPTGVRVALACSGAGGVA